MRTITVEIDTIARALNALEFRARQYERDGVLSVAAADREAAKQMRQAWIKAPTEAAEDLRRTLFNIARPFGVEPL
jgi:hypothetical protein